MRILFAFLIAPLMLLCLGSMVLLMGAFLFWLNTSNEPEIEDWDRILKEDENEKTT
jgi:hypothetical protein